MNVVALGANGMAHKAAWHKEKQTHFEMEKLEKRLIKRVYEHDLLYKIDHIHYRDKQMRAAAWKDIAEDLGIPGKKKLCFCKCKWLRFLCVFLSLSNLLSNVCISD